MTFDSSAGLRLRVQWFGRSVVGCVRKNNEDCFWAGALGAAEGPDTADLDTALDSVGKAPLLRPGTLLAVADGMGGAKAGEVASDMAITIVRDEMRQRAQRDIGPETSTDGFRDALVSAVELANERIRDEGASNPDQRGMGTTLTAVWAYDNVAQIAHVGDSRGYLFRKGNLSRMTKDQSLVEKLLDDKIISPEEAERMAARNIILQALGSEEDLEVAHPRQEIQAGDTILLCTDGLNGVVADSDLEECLRRGGSLQEMSERLIARAEELGGPDNITVLLFRVENEHQASD